MNSKIEKVISGISNISKVANEGDIIFFDSILELDNTKKNNVDVIIKNYRTLLNSGYELQFDRSSSCDSNVVKSYVSRFKEDGVNSKGLLEDLLLLLITTYMDYRGSSASIKKYSQMIASEEDGKSYGRPNWESKETDKAKKAKEIIKKYSKDFNGKLNDDDCIKKSGASRNMFYIYKKQIKKEMWNKR